MNGRNCLSAKLLNHRFYLNIDTYKYIPPDSENEKSNCYWISIPLDFTGRIKFFEEKYCVRAATTGLYFLYVAKSFVQFKKLVDLIDHSYVDKLFREALWSGYQLQDQVKMLFHSTLQAEEDREYLIEDF